jgi:inosine-uridine nucleoside N-ribohydrolase
MRARARGAAFAFIATILVAGMLAIRFVSAQPGIKSQPTSQAAAGTSPINVIFDTDIWSDIDDMMALAMLHGLQDRHEVNLVAVTISTDDPWCASYVDLVNTFYGHPGIPIGIVHDGMGLEVFRKKFPEHQWPVTRYTELISKKTTSRGAPLYPHRLRDGSKALDAVSLLRKTLAAQPDSSVVMIQVGYSTNLARLLDTGGDSSSPLTGRDLVARKVRLLSVMAGNYGDAQFQGKTVPKGTPEFNLLVDVPAAQKVFSSWPTPMVASGFEIGLSMLYPARSIEHDFSYVEHHPIADTYRTYCEEQKARDTAFKRCPHDHPTFDLTAVLYAARPDRNYFDLSDPGNITVLTDGGSRFDESEGGRQRHLILTAEQKARTLEAMVMLVSQPPKLNRSQEPRAAGPAPRM